MKMMPSAGLFEVRDSKIHGKGVFAKVEIEEGTNLGPNIVRGKMVRALHQYRSNQTEDQCDRHAIVERACSQSVMQIGYSNFINHEKRPNSTLRVGAHPDVFETVVTTTLAVGQELTSDYVVAYTLL